VQPHDDQRIQARLTRLRSRDQQFLVWIDGLCDNDPTFARASLLHNDDLGEWQAAVYLLTGCHEAWTALGPEILASRSIWPIVQELDHGHRGWSSSELLLLRWAAHFWDVGLSEVSFPYSFDESNFRRWITACHLYKHIPPALEEVSEAER
jgi:hypothetical protein